MINNKRRYAFTMLELIFVIVIMGIIGKFGVEFLAQAYRNFMFSTINNELQSNSAYATELIAKKLEHRIKQSVIYRDLNLSANSDDNFRFLVSGVDENATVLEWIGTDIEGYRGDGATPYWSGVVDLNTTLTNLNQITSIDTNTTNIDNRIKLLSDNNSTVDDAAIYFVGPYSANHEWGWDGTVSTFDILANTDIFPINDDANITIFKPAPSAGAVNTFDGVYATEYYKLSWTAYAVSFTNIDPVTKMGNLILYYNYQPWKGEQYDDAGIGVKQVLLMEDVSSFQYRAVGSTIKIQVCTKNTLITNEDYSICKEKTVY